MILFFPTFWGYFGSAGISKGQIIYTMVVLIIGITLLMSKHDKFKIPHIFTILFTLLLISYTVTLSLNSIIFQSKISLNDFSDLYRPLVYLISLSIGYSLFSPKVDLHKLIKFLVCAIILCSLFDIIKLLPGTRPILDLYTHLGGLNFMRFSGTFCYCYNYVYVLLMGLLLTSFCSNKKLLYLLLFTILILLAGSRAGFIAYIICIAGYNFLTKRFVNAVLSCLCVILLTVTIIVIVSYLEIPLFDNIFANAEKLFNALFSDGEDGSMMTRNNQLNRAINNLTHNPFFGVGPQKGDERPIEIQLGYYLSSWGIVGTTIFLSIILSFLAIAWKMKNHPGVYGNFSKANFLWIICSFVMGMSTPITDQIRVSQIFFLIQGIQFSIFMINRNRVLKRTIFTVHQQ